MLFAAHANFYVSKLESFGELTTARGAHKRTLMPRPLVNHPAPEGYDPLDSRGFRAASTSGDTCSFSGASLFGSGCFDLHRDYPIRVSNRTILYINRSSVLRGVLMRKITHQSYIAVGRGMCTAYLSVRDRKRFVTHVYQNV